MNKKLELLQFNHAGAMILKNGITANYGVIRFDGDNLVYFTGRGLREIWAPNMTAAEKAIADILKAKSEEELKVSGHIAVTPLKDIEQVLY